MTGWVRRTPYEREGVIVRGAWHFAPGEKVYVEPPMSGDGWERTYMVARHRETGQWTRVIGPRSRLRGFHVEEVTDRTALDLLRGCVGWERDPQLVEWMNRIDASAKLPRNTPWADEVWRDAVERAWTPSYAALVGYAARVIDCDEERVAVWARDGSLGARLDAIEKGRWSVAEAEPLRSPARAWELLAPHAWIDDPSRRFKTVKAHEEAAPTAHPTSLGAAVSFASDVADVLAAEEIARELAVTLSLPAVREVTWRIGTLATLQGYIESRTNEPQRVIALGRALLRDDDDGAAEAMREEPALPWRAVFDLVSLGYGIATIGEGRAELIATEPSRARVKDGW